MALASALLTPSGHLARGSRRARVRRVPVFAVQGERPHSPQRPTIASAVAKLCGAAAAGLILNAGVAEASIVKVGEFNASGFIFKDSVELLALDDKEVDGVTIYITDFKRSITEKLTKDFFNEPSQASLTCAITGPVLIKNPENIKSSDGKEIFAERKNLLNLLQNKTLRVRRMYDEKNNTLIYVAYSTRTTSSTDDGVSTGRYRTSICALPLANAPTVTAEPPPVATE